MGTLKQLREKGAFQNLATVVLVVAECVIFSIMRPNFFTFGNFTNIITQMATLTILSLGITFVIVCGGIDLSLGSIISLTSVVTGSVLVSTQSITLGILSGTLCGLAFGLVNGYFVAYKGMQPFAVTLGTMSIGKGLALVLCGGNAVRGLPKAFSFIGNGKLWGIPFQILVVLVLAVASYILLQRVPFGKTCYAVGGNKKASFLSGVNVNRVHMMSFVICGIMASFAGIVATARVSSGLPTLGSTNIQMQAIAAAIIGGASMSGGRGNIVGTLLGSLFISILYNGANMIGVSSYGQDVLIGAIIMISAGFDLYRRKKQG